MKGGFPRSMTYHAILFSAGLLAFAAGIRAEQAAETRQDGFVTDEPVVLESASQLALKSDYAPTFHAVVQALESLGEKVVLVDPEAGVVATAIQVAGEFRQTGTRLVVYVSKGNYQHTFVEVTVTVQQRFQSLRREPWGTPVLDPRMSRDAVRRLRWGLGLEN